MMKTFPAYIIFGLFLLIAMPGAAMADEPLDTGQSIIRKQIAAFLNDDAATAYSFASPAIQGKFVNQDMFFEMSSGPTSPYTGRAILPSAAARCRIARSCRKSSSAVPTARTGRRCTS